MVITTSTTQTQLNFKLLGTPQVILGNHVLTAWGPAKAQALAYYLVANGEPIPRSVLADLLWPKVEDLKARRYLSKHLVQLRKYFESFLLITPKSLTFSAEAVTVDLHQVKAHLQQAKKASDDTA